MDGLDEGLGAKGHLKDPGHPLERTGKVVKGKQKTVTDGPYAEAKDVVGGYTLVEAKDLAQAVELSKGCPISKSEARGSSSGRDNEDVMELDDHLFRREAGRMVAALTRIFGVHNLALAEDVVQDAFCRALEVWKFRGVPDNPSAWLMATAKNRALDVLRRERTARTFAPELGRLLESEWTLAPVVEELFGANAINDDQLRMMFSCCHPRLPEEAQVALVLNILCGFSVSEIASAFLSTQAAIEKRISRAKKVLAASKRLFDVADAGDFSARLSSRPPRALLAVQRGLPRRVRRVGGARRTVPGSDAPVALLLEHPLGRTPRDARARRAHVSPRRAIAGARRRAGNRARSSSRIDRSGTRSRRRRAEAPRALRHGCRADRVSRRGGHRVGSRARASRGGHGLGNRSFRSTTRLMTIRPSPVVALNRAIAVAQHDGPERGLEEIRAIADRDRLAAYPFYSAALGELEFRRGGHETAREHFQAALASRATRWSADSSSSA